MAFKKMFNKYCNFDYTDNKTITTNVTHNLEEKQKQNC